MSGDARISGRIRIEPPVTWGELHDKPWATDPRNEWPDVVVELATTKENVADGEVLRHSGVAIVTTEHETSAYELVRQTTRIVKAFGTAPDGTARRFAGFLHVVWGGGEEVYRVIVREGRAVEVKPVLAWPEGARDEDGAS